MIMALEYVARDGGHRYSSTLFQNDGAPMTGPCNEASYHVPYDKAGIIIGKGQCLSRCM